MAKTNVRQVSIFINGKEVENTIKSIAAEQRKLTNELALTVRGSDDYVRKSAELNRVNTILRDHRQGVSGIKQGWDLTKLSLDKFVGLAAGAFTVDAVIGYGKELFHTAVQMEALEKKAKIVFGETLPQVTEAAKENASAMGLTTQQYVSAAAAIQDILVPMGFQRKEAADISSQLVNLSGALSEWTGGQVSATQVSDILASALTGEREQLKQLGIVLQQSDIDARLAAKGLDGLTGQLKQQAEATATLDLILQKSQDAQTSFAENADTMGRKTAELTARFEDIKEKLATALVPVFEGFVNILGDIGDGIDYIGETLSNPVFKAAIGGTPTGGTLLDTIFGTKKDQSATLEGVKTLQKEADELLAKYGIVKEKQGAFNPDAGKVLTAAERKQAAAKAKKAAEQAKEDADYEARTASQIKRAQELQGVLSALVDKESKKRRESLQLEQEYLLDSYVATKEQQKLVDINYEQEKADATEQVRLFLQSDKDAEIEALQNHYAVLLGLAEQYGIETSALREKQEKDLAEINDRYANEELQKQYDFQQARLQALQSMFSEFGNLVTATFDFIGAEGEKSAAFQKVATLAKIAFDTASAISSLVAASEANPANAFTFGAAGVAQYVAGIARVLSNIAQAKKILAGAPQVKQKAGGGFLTVTGADDGRTYSASVIPTPYTGLLPNHPVLFQSGATGAPVLASERGAEYFVSADALRNPYVANLTMMIDSIAGGGVRQFADGGVNAPTANTQSQPTSATDTAVMRELAGAVNTLNALLDRGIIAIVPDGTVLDINKRFGKINKASGGYYG